VVPLALDLGAPEILIILAIALLLFGGSRLAGLGKSAGRAIREFKDETRSLSEPQSAQSAASQAGTASASTTSPATNTATTSASDPAAQSANDSAAAS